MRGARYETRGFPLGIGWLIKCRGLMKRRESPDAAGVERPRTPQCLGVPKRAWPKLSTIGTVLRLNNVAQWFLVACSLFGLWHMLCLIVFDFL